MISAIAAPITARSLQQMQGGDVRRLFLGVDSGLTSHALRWSVHRGDCQRVQRNVYAEGREPISQLDRERAKVLVADSVARGGLAGVLLGLDSVELDGCPTRRNPLAAEHVVVVEGTPCADGYQTLVDLAARLEDDVWEQALESALRKRLVAIVDFDSVPPSTPGVRRIRRVLARRGDAPPTESLLETLMVQVARTVPGLGDPTRQYEVTWADGRFVARVDLCWPALGLFIELDGQGHEDQPVYDATRQTAVVAATGWLVGRFTWREVRHTPKTTARRLAALVHAARSRSVA